jgi:prolipoprotein diacylglyceryltransferase
LIIHQIIESPPDIHYAPILQLGTKIISGFGIIKQMQTFSILLGLGAMAGLLLVSWRAPKKETMRYLDAGLVVMFGAMCGSRAMTVAVNWGYYQAHAREIYQVWLGGLSGVGALVGGILTVIIVARLGNFPAGQLADTLIPLAGTLAITAWLGCWMDSCGYGLPSSAWWALPGRDEWGVLARRVPVQLAGALLTLGMFWLLERASKRLPRSGISASVGLLGLAVELFALSFFRADPMPVWLGLRLEAWGTLGLAVFSILSLAVLFRQRMKDRKYKNPPS